MKCKYIKVCDLYNKKGVICNKEGGKWGERMASCYYRMEERENKK